jgi:hypothetical protein
MPDRSELVTLLRDSAAVFTGAFRGLDPAQFHFSPGPGRWSIAQTVEHVILAETGSVKLMRGRMAREAAPPDVLAATEGGDERIERRLGRRTAAFPAPDFVLPTGQWTRPDEMEAAFLEARSAAVEFLETSPLDLARHAAAHPALGPLTALQWAHFLVRHCLRHVEQIDEVKAAAGYPAGGGAA